MEVRVYVWESPSWADDREESGERRLVRGCSYFGTKRYCFLC